MIQSKCKKYRKVREEKGRKEGRRQGGREEGMVNP